MKPIRGYSCILLWLLIGWLGQAWAAKLRVLGVQGPMAEQLEHIYQRQAKEASSQEMLVVMEQALRPYGYVQAKLTWVSPDTVRVVLGPQAHWRQVVMHCQGEACARVGDALRDFSVKEGQVFDVERYQQALERLRMALQRRGYITAWVQPSVQLFTKAHCADAQILVVLGPSFRWGQLSWSGTTLDPDVLAGFVRRAGGIYNPSIMTAIQSDLMRSGYFETVSVNPVIDHRRRQVQVHVTAKDLKRTGRTLGVGFDTDKGWQGFFQMNWPRLNARGHKLYWQANVGTRESTMAIRYLIPGYNILYDQWLAGLQLQRERKVGVGNTTTASLQLQHLRYAPRWRSDVGFKALIEHASPLGRSNYNSTLLYPEGRYTRYWSWGEHHLNRLRWGLSGRGAKRHWLSTVSFAQLESELTGNITWSPRWRWLYRGRLGHTWSASLADVPLSLQYTTGGAHRLRGYPYDSIGPGRWLVEASVANYLRLAPGWLFSQFFDAGQVSNAWNHRLKRAAGAGFLWLTAVGGIELSLAHPIHDPCGEWRLNLGVHSRRFFPVWEDQS